MIAPSDPVFHDDSFPRDWVMEVTLNALLAALVLDSDDHWAFDRLIELALDDPTLVGAIRSASQKWVRVQRRIPVASEIATNRRFFSADLSLCASDLGHTYQVLFELKVKRNERYGFEQLDSLRLSQPAAQAYAWSLVPAPPAHVRRLSVIVPENALFASDRWRDSLSGQPDAMKIVETRDVYWEALIEEYRQWLPRIAGSRNGEQLALFEQLDVWYTFTEPPEV